MLPVMHDIAALDAITKVVGQWATMPAASCTAECRMLPVQNKAWLTGKAAALLKILPLPVCPCNAMPGAECQVHLCSPPPCCTAPGACSRASTAATGWRCTAPSARPPPRTGARCAASGRTTGASTCTCASVRVMRYPISHGKLPLAARMQRNKSTCSTDAVANQACKPDNVDNRSRASAVAAASCDMQTTDVAVVISLRHRTTGQSSRSGSGGAVSDVDTRAHTLQRLCCMLR